MYTSRISRKMTEQGGDVEMLVGISKHMANVSDNKKQRVSTTALSLQETLKEKLVSCYSSHNAQGRTMFLLLTAKVQRRESESASGVTVDPPACMRHGGDISGLGAERGDRRCGGRR